MNRTEAATAADVARAAAEDASADAYAASTAGASAQHQQEHDAKAAGAWASTAQAEAEATKLAYEEGDNAGAFHHAAAAYSAAALATCVAEQHELATGDQISKTGDHAENARASAHQAGANAEGAW